MRTGNGSIQGVKKHSACTAPSPSLVRHHEASHRPRVPPMGVKNSGISQQPWPLLISSPSYYQLLPATTSPSYYHRAPPESSHRPSCQTCLEPEVLCPLKLELSRATPSPLESEMLLPWLESWWGHSPHTWELRPTMKHVPVHWSQHPLALPHMQPHACWTRHLSQLQRHTHETSCLPQLHMHPHTHQTQPACSMETTPLRTPRTGILTHLPTWIHCSPHPANILAITHERRSLPASASPSYLEGKTTSSNMKTTVQDCKET